MRISRLSSYLIPLVCACGTVALLQVKCDQGSQPPAKNGRLRIASYNVEWMNEGISKEREANLRSVIRSVNPDILAMQEIQSRAALKRILGPEWSVSIADDVKEDQELALAVRKPMKIVRHAVLFKSPRQDFAFPGRRNALRALVRSAQGEEIEIYVVHSRAGAGLVAGRRQTGSESKRRVYSSKNSPVARRGTWLSWEISTTPRTTPVSTSSNPVIQAPSARCPTRQGRFSST